MEQHTFDVGYRRLKAYYQQTDNEDKYNFWMAKLQPLPGAAYQKAVDLWLEGEKFPPTLSQLKAMIYNCRTPEEIGVAKEDEPLTEAEIALNKDLFPLFNKYLNGQTGKREWRQQVRYFTEKHGLWETMMEGQEK